MFERTLKMMKNGVYSSSISIFVLEVIIVSILAFLNKRQSFKKDYWGGRPGLVIPLNFLGIDHNRLAISAIFTASAELILEAVLAGLTVENNVSKWVKGFIIVASAIEVAILYFPLFACLTTEHKLVGSIMGLLYSLILFTLGMLVTFDIKCIFHPFFFVPAIISNIPIMICYLFILGKFLTVLYLEARKRISWIEETKHDGNDSSTFRSELTKPWLIQHVKEVLKPRLPVPEKRCIRFLRLIYSPERNFRFSTLTVSIVLVCCIFLFAFTVEWIHVGRKLIEYDLLPKDTLFCNTNLTKPLGNSLVASALLLAVFCIFSIIRFMECHKNNMLRMFKGDTSFIPKQLKRSQLMVGKCLKYAGYHIAFFIWGYILLLGVFFVFTCFLAGVFHCGLVRKLLENILESSAPFLLVTLPLWIILIISSMTIFNDASFKKDTITINNRNVYLVVSYFFFFLGLPMGFFTAILRVLKAIAIGFFMLPRVDQSVMLDGFQKFDNGFAAYICHLHVQAAHRNPVLRVFCQVVHNAMHMTRADGTLKTTKQYRNKWFLLVTLMRNPQLKGCRKHAIAPPVVRFVVNTSDVSVEMPNIGKYNLY